MVLDEAWCSLLAVRLRLGEAFNAQMGGVAPFQPGALGGPEDLQDRERAIRRPCRAGDMLSALGADADRPLGRPIRS